MKISIAAIFAIAAGLIVLIGFVYPLPVLTEISTYFLSWAVVVAGVATLVGIINLIGVHLRKPFRHQNRDFYSPVLIASFFITLVIGLWLTPADKSFQHVVTSIQVPVETSLLAILSITLLAAVVKLFRMRKGLMLWSFLISAVLFIIFGSGMLVIVSDRSPLSNWIAYLNIIPLAGARGILIGVALGSLMTGLRLLFGSDRPYDG